MVVEQILGHRHAFVGEHNRLALGGRAASKRPDIRAARELAATRWNTGQDQQPQRRRCMNEFVRLADRRRDEINSPDDLTWLSLELAETPCGPLYSRHISSDRELAAALAQ